ncbi:MAG: dihydroneopterin aldolase [Spirulinaceae cyanobacterium RM2_2_10]|nr:dihydroneopterin aldolase [Spirulinaceae cyanobacterium SM2_1_0]NJO20294.1 dihydroneopterin aldolase [Spirulinaceae cyanobacterium RM2_2_10]
MQNFDLLHVRQIRAYGYTGLLPEERRLGQWFEVDLSLWLDLAPAAASDVIAETFDYVQAVTAVQELIQTQSFQLIETLAEAIAQLSLADPRIQQVRVQLTKLTPPIANFSGCVTVELTRSPASSHPSGNSRYLERVQPS